MRENALFLKSLASSHQLKRRPTGWFSKLQCDLVEQGYWGFWFSSFVSCGSWNVRVVRCRKGLLKESGSVLLLAAGGLGLGGLQGVGLDLLEGCLAVLDLLGQRRGRPGRIPQGFTVSPNGRDGPISISWWHVQHSAWREMPVILFEC